MPLIWTAHTYLNIGISLITWLFDGVFMRLFLGHLTIMAATHKYGKTKYVLL